MQKSLLCGLLCIPFSAAAVFAQPVTGQCVLWLRADHGVSVHDTGRVSQVLDASGQAHHAVQGGTTAGPLLIPNAMNGLPAMRFAGGQWLDLAGQVLSSNQFTIITVVTDTRTDGSFREIISNWNFNNNVTSVFFGTTAFDPQGPDTTRARLTDDVGGANQGQQGAGAIVNRTSPFIFTGISRANNAEVYQERTLIAQRETPISPRNFSGPWVIGRQGPISEFWDGDIAEILVYDRDLSRCELDVVYDYLNDKYGIAPCLPNITSEPGGALVCPGGDAVFSIVAGGGICEDNLLFRWSSASTGELVDGPLASGAVVSGAFSSTLTISGTTFTDEDTFFCTVSNSCGDVFSELASLQVCPADFNCDGGVDGSDVSAFFSAWEAGEFFSDINVDGGIDGSDVQAFFFRWENGC